MDTANFENAMNVLFGIVAAVLKYLRAINAITQDDIDKFNGIFGKITSEAGSIKEDIENM